MRSPKQILLHLARQFQADAHVDTLRTELNNADIYNATARITRNGDEYVLTFTNDENNPATDVTILRGNSPITSLKRREPTQELVDEIVHTINTHQSTKPLEKETA